MKNTCIILGIIVIVLGGLVWAVLCGPLVVLRFKAVDVEILRLDSPDGKVDAVYIQRDAGAMTSTAHLIYVVADGQNPIEEKVRAVFEGSRLWDMDISWISNQELLIRYSEGYIYGYRNYAYPFPENYEYKVKIREEQISSEK